MKALNLRPSSSSKEVLCRRFNKGFLVGVLLWNVARGGVLRRVLRRGSRKPGFRKTWKAQTGLCRLWPPSCVPCLSGAIWMCATFSLEVGCVFWGAVLFLSVCSCSAFVWWEWPVLLLAAEIACDFLVAQVQESPARGVAMLWCKPKPEKQFRLLVKFGDKSKQELSKRVLRRPTSWQVPFRGNFCSSLAAGRCGRIGPDRPQRPRQTPKGPRSAPKRPDFPGRIFCPIFSEN